MISHRSTRLSSSCVRVNVLSLLFEPPHFLTPCNFRSRQLADDSIQSMKIISGFIEHQSCRWLIERPKIEFLATLFTRHQPSLLLDDVDGKVVGRSLAEVDKRKKHLSFKIRLAERRARNHFFSYSLNCLICVIMNANDNNKQKAPHEPLFVNICPFMYVGPQLVSPSLANKQTSKNKTKVEQTKSMHG